MIVANILTPNSFHSGFTKLKGSDLSLAYLTVKKKPEEYTQDRAKEYK